MKVGQFLKLVEIQTKVASMIPFFIGTLYALFRFHEFRPVHFLLMFVSLLSFDMATTAINNYIDYKKAIKTHGYGYEIHNAIVSYGLKESTVVWAIASLLVAAISSGIALVLQTDILILGLGGLSFLVGFLYSLGPIAISRMPLGELFSGLFMGFVIIFISAYIHVDKEQLVSLTLDLRMAHLDINIMEVLLVFVISIPAILGIANIMLANNICDIEDDLVNKRYTLPVYIGKPSALVLFQWLYAAAYLDVIVLYIIGVHPVLLLLIAATFVPVSKNMKGFIQEQTKERTFVLAVKNFVLMNVTRILVFGLAILFA
ncbi:prenyltransferase [Paenibacillus alvei]|uniref:Prenyltransferase n=1 Tax=Paenibacillus alvei TaxID=44250 RepID=A0ABT4GRQ9_PAEAL|nr:MULTISPECIES: prenyltransferase [Paenibacillus]EJW18618.1 UbiA prenyltransferase [Paenibacillus alvei DSM 29]MCY7484178.1 prenyltransferase [Paenibacillus alvei]MCY9539782.1 prenyltransferase [Paenibacillus alvei]MCY9703303.1 prenyltransferase [Paenibacillus alvei]MCY9735475.1 prenyltransferase [Paenibacillus alvei]